MQIIEKGNSSNFKEYIGKTTNLNNSYGLIFQLSKLNKVYNNEFQIRIVLNIIHDLLKDMEGLIISSSNNNIIVIVHDTDSNLPDKCIFQIRYLFEDEGEYLNNSEFNTEIYQTYFLKYQLKEFKKNAATALGATSENHSSSLDESEEDEFNLNNIINALDSLNTLEISQALRTQAICAKPKKGNFKPIFYELFISNSHLKAILDINFDLRSEPLIYNYIKKFLDKKILLLLLERRNYYFNGPLSLNLSIESLQSPEFIELNHALSPEQISNLVIELNYSDVFTDIQTFLKVRDAVKSKGYKLLLDQADHHSIFHINTKTLGFDLVKLCWNYEMEEEIENLFEDLEIKLREIGKNRLILAGTDNKYALNYGTTLGISIYQGLQIDKLLKPEFVL